MSKSHRSSPSRSTPFRRLAASAAVTAISVGTATAAHAEGLNDPNCKPTAAHPYPVVVVHGQAGNYEAMTGVTGTLVAGGYCVFARNYGKVPGGANGQDHLATSAGQISAFVDQVLAETGAKKVDVVGHSAGTGVLDNYILKKGGAAKVHNMVSFGGLHHPYAHAGLATKADASLFLPNIIAVARKVVPGITTKQIVKTALDVYAVAGAPLGPVDPGLVATMESNFTVDLFDPDYWTDLHGKLSEKPMSFVRIGQSERTFLTNDADPNICYTNIVAAADLLVSGAAGFQDAASNIDNFVDITTLTSNAHNDMLGDPVDLLKMLSGLDATCVPAGAKAISQTYDIPGGAAPEDTESTSDFEEAVFLGRTGERKPLGADTGCSVSAGTPRERGDLAGLLGSGVAVALGALVIRRRRRA